MKQIKDNKVYLIAFTVWHRELSKLGKLDKD